MGKIRVLLWDIDGTVLNFLAAEKVAIRTGFKRLNMGECTDEMLEDYSEINKKYWQMLERGEMTKQEILVGRFKEFFEKYNLEVQKAEEFNSHYQIDLGDTICFNDNADDIIKELNEKYLQYAVTNGTVTAQNKKLNLSGLKDIFKECFISDEIGFEKPRAEFFKPVFEAIKRDLGEVALDEIMIIGDSLTSDMQGGINAGIINCWYNPSGERNDKIGRIEYEIKSLKELDDILK